MALDGPLVDEVCHGFQAVLAVQDSQVLWVKFYASFTGGYRARCCGQGDGGQCPVRCGEEKFLYFAQVPGYYGPVCFGEEG